MCTHYANNTILIFNLIKRLQSFSIRVLLISSKRSKESKMSKDDESKAKLLSQIIGAIDEFDFTTASQINGYLKSLLDMYEVE
jgi:hypothetical protein